MLVVQLVHWLAQSVALQLQLLGCSVGFPAWSPICHRHYHHNFRPHPSSEQQVRRLGRVEAVEVERVALLGAP